MDETIAVLVKEILTTEYQVIGTGAGMMLKAWPITTKELAQYAAELQAENARLEAALGDTAAQLVDAVQRAQEAEYNLHLMTKQADANYHRAREAEASLVKYQTVTVARRCKQEIICDGDGDSPDWCKKSAEWEVQRMREDGSDYSYVCTDHLSDYQKWADEAGYSPLVFEIEQEVQP